MSHNHGKAGSPAHILMSHGGHQMHLASHDVFHPKAKKYARGGHATSDEPREARGGRRHSRSRHENRHTGHPEYFSFGDFLNKAQNVASKVKSGINTGMDYANKGMALANQYAPMAQQIAGQFSPKIGNAIGQGLNMANQAHGMAQRGQGMANAAGNVLGFDHGGHVNPHTGHPDYFSFGDFLRGAQQVAGHAKNALNTGVGIANQLAPMAQQFLPGKIGNAIGQGLNMANTANNVANTAGNMFGFAHGGHVNPQSGHPQYYGFNDFVDTLGHVGGALAPLAMFLAQGGPAVGMEGQARANAAGGPQMMMTSNADRGGGGSGYADGGMPHPMMMHAMGMHGHPMHQPMGQTPAMSHGGRRKKKVCMR